MVARRDRARLKEIIETVSGFGLGVLLARFGLEKPGGGVGAGGDFASLPRRTRLALEQLGPTFVKLGQILATRADLLEPEWIAELEQLQSSAPTLPFEDLRAEVEEALGEPPEEAFDWFDPVPLAAASIAQVHRARLKTGQDVVLKIRRPGIRPRMEADLRLIAHAASVGEAASAELRRLGPAALMAQLAEAVLAELDFTAEGRNADRMAADFANDKRIVLPTIYWEYTSETLLVMDYIDGLPPRSAEELREAGIDPQAIAALGADAVLDMVLINGRFHADPHPGNLLCLPGNRIALLDLGMIGHVSPRRREEFIDFVQSLNAGDPARLADVLMIWGEGSGPARDRVQQMAERLIARHGGGHIVLAAMVTDFLALIREEEMALPPDLLLAFKSLITLDGVLQGIDPQFNLTSALKRATLRIAKARLSPAHWGPALQALGWELAKIGDDAPRLIRAAIRKLEAEPIQAASGTDAAALRDAARWIAGSVVIAGALVAGAIAFV